MQIKCGTNYSLADVIAQPEWVGGPNKRLQETVMNRDRYAGRWMQIVGKTKEMWVRLTHDSQAELAGRYDYLVGKNRERYGIARERAARQLREFHDRNRHWDLTNE